MFRFAFAVKFKGLVGETPLEYLTNWRMHKDTALLRNGDKKLADVARTVGYDSDAVASDARLSSRISSRTGHPRLRFRRTKLRDRRI
jgi:AraC-like DNA-binding protein